MSQPDPDLDLELITSERVAKIVHSLHLGHTYTTRNVAEEIGITWDGAYKMMHRIARVIPVTQIRRRWTLIID